MKRKYGFITFILSIVLVSLVCFGLVACTDKDKTYKSVTDITCDGTTVSWQHEDFGGEAAMEFVVKIGENSATVNGLSYQYNANYSEFTVSIETLYKTGKNGNKSESGGVVTKSFKPLPAIQGVKMEEEAEILCWDPVENATGYVVRMETDNGVFEEKVVGTSFDKLVGGRYSVRVRPVNSNESEGWYGTYSAPLNVEVLSSPSGLQYDSVTEVIKWNSVSGATGGYKLYILSEGEEQEIAVASTTYKYLNLDKTFEIKVKATSGSTQVYDSAYSESVRYTYIPPVSNFIVEDGTLKWDSTGPEGTVYRIKINDVTQSATLESPEYGKFPIGSATRVSIKPILKDGFSFSSWSPDQTITILAAPSGVEYKKSEERSVIEWQSVQGASGYRVDVYKNGNLVDEPQSGGNVFNCDVNRYIDGAAKYEFKVYAIADSPNYYGSKASATVTVTKLATPSGLTVTDDPYDYAKTFLTFSGVPENKGYKVLYGDVECNDFLASTKVNISGAVRIGAAGESCTVSVIAKGSEKPQGTNVFIESDPASTVVTKLAAPTKVFIRANKLYFNDVVGANGYIVYIDGISADNGHDIADSGEMFSVSLTSGTHKLALRAKGDSGSVLSSDLSLNDDNKMLEVYKLDAPRLKIENEQLFLEFCDQKDGSTTKIFFDNDSNEFSGFYSGISIYDRVSTKGTSIYARTYANVDNVISSEKDAQGLRPQKLSAPANFRLDSGNLSWNKVAWTVSYTLYHKNVSMCSGISNNSYSTTDLEYIENDRENSDFELKVRANGNGSSIFSSDLSSSVKFTLLAKPQITISADGKKYVWEPIEGAVGYELEIPGNNKVTLNSSVREWAPTFNKVGSIDVTVRALGNYSSSINSKDDKFTQSVKQLEIPKITAVFNTELRASVSNTNEYTVFGDKVTYSFFSSGTPVVGGNGGSSVGLGKNAGQYKVSCSVNGKFFFGEDANDKAIFYLSNDSTISTYTILSQPTKIELSKSGTANATAKYSLQWGSVSGAVGYSGVITLHYEDQHTESKTISGSATIYSLGTLKNDGVVSVSYEIMAIGDGVNCFSGETITGTEIVN